MKSNGLPFEGLKIRKNPCQGTVRFTDFLEFPLIGVPAKSWVIHAG